METKEIVNWLRDKACRADNPSWTRMMHTAADHIMRLEHRLHQSNAERDAVTKRMIELEQKHRWIPVEERLPERITNKVIVMCKNGYRGFGHYENYKGKQTWYNLENDRPFTDLDLEDCESYEVTHWMPLPEPPKEVNHA